MDEQTNSRNATTIGIGEIFVDGESLGRAMQTNRVETAAQRKGRMAHEAVERVKRVTRTAACTRLPHDATADQIRDAHRARMLLRKANQATRRPGFTPVTNGRVDARIQAAAIAAMIINPQLSPAAADAQARRQVAPSLPPRSMVKSYRPRPSRSDHAAYRK